MEVLISENHEAHVYTFLSRSFLQGNSLNKPGFSNRRNFITVSDYSEAGNQVWVVFGRSAGWPSHFKGWFTPMDSIFSHVIAGHPHSETVSPNWEMLECLPRYLMPTGFYTWVPLLIQPRVLNLFFLKRGLQDGELLCICPFLPLGISTLHSGMDSHQALGGVLDTTVNRQMLHLLPWSCK